MKIGRNNSGLVVSLTEQEHEILFRAEYVKVQMALNHQTEWIRLEKADTAAGNHRLSPCSNDLQHSVRLEMHGRSCPVDTVFATEHVAAKSPMGGILYGARPTMERPLMRQLKGSNRIANPANMPGLEELKQAVAIINNFRKIYGEQMEVVFDGKELKVRMMLEI